MLANFPACVSFTLLPSNDGQPCHITPGDTGGATAYGITRATLSRWMLSPASVDDVKNLTVEKTRAIYQGFYWNTISGDSLPYGVDLMVFDHGVLAGEGEASRELQQVVGLTGDDVDGHIGPITLAAVHSRDPVDLVAALHRRQEMYYRMCANFPLFGNGWLARLTRRVEAATLMLSPVVAWRN